MGRTPCCDKEKMKRGAWSPEEDALLTAYLNSHHGCPRNWISLPQKAGLRRCGKSCRLRWMNYLRPHIKRGSFTQEEDNIIFSLYAEIGSRWSVIAAKMPGRTDNDVKNHWNTKLKKKLIATPKKMAKDEPNNNQSFTPDHSSSNNHNVYVPSFTSLLAQANYNASPLGYTNTFLFDQFMFSSAPTYPQGEEQAPNDQLLLSVKSEEAQLSTVSGSSSSLFVDQTHEYLAYPSDGRHNLEDDLLFKETRSLTFDQSDVYSF